jgi:hypothetical protein
MNADFIICVCLRWLCELAVGSGYGAVAVEQFTTVNHSQAQSSASNYPMPNYFVY